MQGSRVIVAGAGLAGLSAADELARAGAAVTIVDARPRAGGRVWTAGDGFAGGHYGELGGEFVDEQHGRMRALAARFDLPLVRVLRGGFTHRYRTAGGELRVSRAGPWAALGEVLAPLVRRYRAARGRDASGAIREMATWSLREAVERHGASPDVHAMVNSIRGFFLAEAEELSVLPVVAQLADRSPAQTPIYRIAGGASRLVEALIAGTPARLLLGQHVRAVAQAVDRVIVRMTDAHGLRQDIEADAVVMALPASTLRDVEITPPLPEAQWRAIGRLCYGPATKVVLQCEGPGLSARRAQAFATDGSLGAFWDATDGQPRSAARSVLAFLGGGAASARLRARAGTAPESLLADLCWLNLAGTPVLGSHMVSWERDPLARGGYAFADPAFDPAWKPLLARRAGRIVFAGEHTSADYQGYMEGAVESGQRAAGELMN